MLSLWTLRMTASSLAFSFFGYFCPAFSSIKAVLSRDIDAIREYLTYWSVFGIILYIETIIKYFSWSVLQRYPPEFKVLVILWLTLPRFQGAYRIYILIIKPHFELHEKHLDTLIEKGVSRVKESLSATAQRLAYQLLMQSNETLLSSIMTASSSIASVAMPGSTAGAGASDGSSTEAGAGDMARNAVLIGAATAAVGKAIGEGGAVTSMLASSVDRYMGGEAGSSGGRGTARRRSSMHRGHGQGHHQPGRPVNLLLEFCYLLQDGITVYIPTYGGGQSCNLMGAIEDRELFGAGNRPTDPSFYREARLELNRHKNQLTCSFPRTDRKASSAKKSTSDDLVIYVPLWNVSQIFVDDEDIDDDEDFDSDGEGECRNIFRDSMGSGVDGKEEKDDEGKVGGKGRRHHHLHRHFTTKVLVLETIRPLFLSNSSPEEGSMRSLSVLASLASLSANADTGKGGSSEDISDAVAEADQLLDSMMYGLPLLVQQLKSKLKQKWGRIERIIAPRVAKYRAFCESVHEACEDLRAEFAEEERKRVVAINRKSLERAQSTAEAAMAMRRTSIVDDEFLQQAEELLLLPEERNSSPFVSSGSLAADEKDCKNSSSDDKLLKNNSSEAKRSSKESKGDGAAADKDVAVGKFTLFAVDELLALKKACMKWRLSAAQPQGAACRR